MSKPQFFLRMGMMTTDDRTYILYDSRAADGTGTEDASVLEVCNDDKEACEAKGDYGGMACYSYYKEGNNLVDERFEWNWFSEF